MKIALVDTPGGQFLYLNGSLKEEGDYYGIRSAELMKALGIEFQHLWSKYDRTAENNWEAPEFLEELPTEPIE